MSIPRNEYPRPQMVREDWLCLNGEWQFEIDNAKSGKEKSFFDRQELDQKIIVPFCPESCLSGIGNTDFMYSVWYKRKVTMPKEWSGKNIILHIGAADYKTTVYVNGKTAGIHRGGYTPFQFDITKLLTDGENDITICCDDDYSGTSQCFGKQCKSLKSVGCFYTRTTGIWQTVWLEAVESLYIKEIKLTPDAANKAVLAEAVLSEASMDARVNMRVYFDGRPVGAGSVVCQGDLAKLNVALTETHLWDIGCGNLYDVELEVISGDKISDSITSYFGLRSVALKDNALCINGRPVFMRLVLDQGFYPDGIYTAPSDEALKADIEYSMQLGFNGARLHEKVFEPRYLYWADKLGYIVWGEHANWNLDHTKAENIYNFLPEWTESIKRDYNHPSIIGWCPFNETWDRGGHVQFDELIGMVYDVTKLMDNTRPCIDTSGHFHVRTDIFDIHDYAQDKETFCDIFTELDKGIIKDQIYKMYDGARQTYKGEPIFVSEYGGIKWVIDGNEDSWGYGEAPKTEEEFKERYKMLTSSLLENKDVMGFCYTQLYDVEQETNGLLTYDREFKFAPEFFYEVNTQIAAIEK